MEQNAGLTVTLEYEGGTEVEGEAVGGVHEEEKSAHSATEPHCCLELYSKGFVDVDIVEAAQNVLRAESLSRADG